MLAADLRRLSVILCVATVGAQFTAEEEQLRCGNRRCLVITQCPELLDLIVKVKEGDSSAKRRLLQNHCGFEGSLPKVCCENKQDLDPRVGLAKRPSLTTFRPVITNKPVITSTTVIATTTTQATTLPTIVTTTVQEPVTSIEFKPTVPFTTPRDINLKNKIKERRQDNDMNSSNDDRDTPTDLEQTKAEDPIVPGKGRVPGNAEQCGKRTSLGFRITFGDTASMGQFPWTVSLVYRRGFGQKQNLCGGALVSDRHVITAAHCVDTSRHKLRLVGVWIGDIELSGEEGVEIGISDVIPHENFHRDPVALFDLAIIKLSQPVEFKDTVRPICLFSGTDTRIEERVGEMIVAGWGRTEVNRRSNVLKYTYLNQISNDVCQSEYTAVEDRLGKLDIREDQLCAKGKEKTDSCGGDSGGPLMAQVDGVWYLAGVVSFGTLKCDSSLPGVYTRISSFEDWLNQNLT